MPGRRKRLSGEELLSTIADLCGGIAYMSETDAPVNPVLEPAGKFKSPVELVRSSLNEPFPIEKKDASNFFAKIARERDWHTEEDRLKARRFAELENVLLGNLDDAALYRAGRVQISLFVLGLDAAGNIVGIRTYAVET